MPIAVVVDGANRHDMKLVERTLGSTMIQRPEPTPDRPQNMCLDKGYDYPEVRELVAAWGYTGHIKSRGEENHPRIPGAALGSGTNPQLAEPVSSTPDPVGEKRGKLCRYASFRLRLDHISGVRSFRIGSK